MPIALYVRVSTTDQHPDAQLEPLRAYAQRRGVDAVEYIDHGVSGRCRSRPALDAMMKALRRREVSAVVVVRLDRLARSLTHMAQLAEELQALGVELVSLTEGIDTASPMGRALFGMCGVFAQLEADLIRDRTRAGMEAARRRGKRIGRPRIERRRHDRIVRLRAAGRSYREIARMVGAARATVERVLKDARATGALS